MPASKYGQQRENGKKTPKTKQMVKMKKNIFEKIRNFSALDERDCQAASLFAHWGQFGREMRAWPDGADATRFHMHIGKIGQFLEVWVSPATQVGLCIDGPQNTAEHLQNTPGTPAIHFPLVAAGSQSALYRTPIGRWEHAFPYRTYTPAQLRLSLQSPVASSTSSCVWVWV